MNSNLKKHLKVYTGVAAAMLAHEKASGQIVYVDINPDTLIEGFVCQPANGIFNLDMNNDALIDFELKASKKAWPCTGFYDHLREIKITPLNGNKVKQGYYWNLTSNSTNLILDPSNLSSGDTIDFSGNWASNSGFLVMHTWTNSSHAQFFSWRGGWWPIYPATFPIEGYLPLMLNISSNNYYGWLRVEVLSDTSFILKDFAYNTIPNAPIIAGDTTNASLGINELSNPIQIISHNNIIHISSNHQISNAKIAVFDLLGKEILSETFSSTQTEISIDKKGIFIVEVVSGETVFRKKVFVF